MNIDTTSINLTPSSAIMTKHHGVVVALEVTGTTGLIHTVNFNQSFPKVETDPLEKPKTLGELITYIIGRQHPLIQYIAEEYGVRVVQYRERMSLSQSFSQIEYSAI